MSFADFKSDLIAEVEYYNTLSVSDKTEAEKQYKYIQGKVDVLEQIFRIDICLYGRGIGGGRIYRIGVYADSQYEHPLCEWEIEEE